MANCKTTGVFPPPPLPSSSSSRMRNLDGWMTGRMDGKDDHRKRTKPRISYILIHLVCQCVCLNLSIPTRYQSLRGQFYNPPDDRNEVSKWATPGLKCSNAKCGSWWRGQFCNPPNDNLPILCLYSKKLLLQEFFLGDFSVHIVHANLNFFRRVVPVATIGIFDKKIRGMLCHRFCLKVDQLMNRFDLTTPDGPLA